MVHKVSKLLYFPQNSMKLNKHVSVAPTSLTNGPPFIEMQAEWIIDVLNKQRAEKIDTIEPKQSEEDAWRENCAHIANQTLAIHTNSWVRVLLTSIICWCMSCFHDSLC
jgi:hypothetical protein